MLEKITKHPVILSMIKNGTKVRSTDLLGEGVQISGTYKSAKNVRVIGSIEGDLHVDGLVTIDEEGTVNGNIFAREIDVSGTVRGDLKSHEKVFVRGTAVVSGAIYTKSLMIEAESVVEGGIQMSDKPLSDTPARKRQAS